MTTFAVSWALFSVANTRTSRSLTFRWFARQLNPPESFWENELNWWTVIDNGKLANQIARLAAIVLKKISLRSGNMGNIFLQLVAQHCCFASCKALLPVLPPPQTTSCTTNFSVASCSNMLHEVELGSAFGNKSWCCSWGWYYGQQSFATCTHNVARITGSLR